MACYFVHDSGRSQVLGRRVTRRNFADDPVKKGSIDGDRNGQIDQIGQIVASQYGLGSAETIYAVKRVLVDAWEDSNIARSDWS